VVASIDLPRVAASTSSRHPTVLSTQISRSTGNTANPSEDAHPAPGADCSYSLEAVSRGLHDAGDLPPPSRDRDGELGDVLRLVAAMSVKCHCCGGTTASQDGGPVICVRCVMELESCRPVSPLPAAAAE
jgi:hypothetical protein